MIPIALRNSSVTLGCEGGRDVSDRVAVPQTDNVPCARFGGGRDPDIKACLLNRAGNKRGRIGEGSIPVEREQAEAPRRVKHRPDALNPARRDID